MQSEKQKCRSMRAATLDSEHSSFAERKGCMAWLQPKLLIPFCQQGREPGGGCAGHAAVQPLTQLEGRRMSMGRHAHSGHCAQLLVHSAAVQPLDHLRCLLGAVVVD